VVTIAKSRYPPVEQPSSPPPLSSRSADEPTGRLQALGPLGGRDRRRERHRQGHRRGLGGGRGFRGGRGSRRGRRRSGREGHQGERRQSRRPEDRYSGEGGH